MATGREGEQERGPSWWDVERFVGELQTRHDCVVLLTWVANVEKGRGVTGWVVCAHAKPPKRLDAPSIQSASAWFRGNRGAKTATAAVWWAVYELDARLAVDGGQAELPGF